MCLAVEIGMFIFGLLALIRGRFILTLRRAALGANARIIGVVLMLPLPLVFGFSSYLAIRGGDLERLPRLEARLTLICLLTALAIAVLTAKPIDSGKTPDPRQDDESRKRTS
jgi:prepilin signal peptidase PulO-like enzyme (type II secretory pathway)